MVVLPAPVEPTKAIFWPGFAYREMSWRTVFLLIVAKDHVVEAHVAPTWTRVPSGFFQAHSPVSNAASVSLPSGFRDPDQLHLAPSIHLRLGLHDFKDPLRAGHGGEDGVHLLGDLCDGLADLPGVLEEGRQVAQQEGAAADGQQGAHAAGDGIVDIARLPMAGIMAPP